MALVIKGSSSGQVTVDVPAAAGTNTLVIPAESGNILTNSTTGTILQVVQSEIATTQNTTSTGYTTSNLTASITPSSTSSKVLMILKWWQLSSLYKWSCYFDGLAQRWVYYRYR